MTQPPQPTGRFAQHPRLAELVAALGFRRYRLFLTAPLYGRAGHGAAGPGLTWFTVAGATEGS